MSDGYTIESVLSAADYLAKAPHSGAACLVLDVRLPGLDGLALQRKLAERGRMEQIVFITGHRDIPMGIQAMKRGAIDFLPKPFDGGGTARCRVAGARVPLKIGESETNRASPRACRYANSPVIRSLAASASRAA